MVFKNVADLTSDDSPDTILSVKGGKPRRTSASVFSRKEDLPNYADMSSARAAQIGTSVGSVVLLGYSTTGDGAEAQYKRVDSEPSHEGKFQSADGAWWEIAENDIDIAMLGASPVSGDNVAAINFAAAVARALGRRLVARKRGTYVLATADPLNLRMVEMDLSGVTFDVQHAAIGLIIGGNASSGNNPPQLVFTATRSGGATATPTVRAVGVKGQIITVERCDYFQVWASTTAPNRNTDYSCAYSKFWIKFAEKLELQSDPTNAGGPQNSDPGGAIQWINENDFYLMRTNTLIIDGTYQHNHNRFWGGTFEGTALIDIKWGRDNKVYGTRFETGPTTINFGTNATNNTILNTWDSGGFESSDTVSTSSTITDSGSYNVVIDDMISRYNSVVVAQSDISDPVINNAVGLLSTRDRQLQKVSGTASNREMAMSEVLPAVVGSVFRYVYQGANPADTVLYRGFIDFYDKDMKPLLPVGGGAGAGFWLDTPHLTQVVAPNRLQGGTGANASYCCLRPEAITAGVAFVRVGVLNSSGGQTANALARRVFVTGSTPGNPDRMAFKPAAQNTYTPVVTAIPTQGFAPTGYTAVKSDGLARYTATFALDTSLSSAAASAATSIGVASGTGTVNGDIIGVNLDDRTTHWTTVASGGGTATIGLTVALPSAAASGSRVVFNRWATLT